MIMGKVKEKNLWIYEVTYAYRSGRDTVMIPEWCLEMEIHPIEEYIIIGRKGVFAFDNIDLESYDFEKKYRIKASNTKHALQLIDPHLMEILLSNPFDVLEISDASIIFYNAKQYIGEKDWKKLDEMIPFAYKVARQIEKNFPLAKYNA